MENNITLRTEEKQILCAQAIDKVIACQLANGASKVTVNLSICSFNQIFNQVFFNRLSGFFH